MTNTFHSPSAATCAKSDLSDLIEALDERQAVRVSVNVLAELGIERDGSFQQE